MLPLKKLRHIINNVFYDTSDNLLLWHDDTIIFRLIVAVYLTCILTILINMALSSSPAVGYIYHNFTDKTPFKDAPVVFLTNATKNIRGKIVCWWFIISGVFFVTLVVLNKKKILKEVYYMQGVIIFPIILAALGALCFVIDFLRRINKYFTNVYGEKYISGFIESKLSTKRRQQIEKNRQAAQELTNIDKYIISIDNIINFILRSTDERTKELNGILVQDDIKELKIFAADKVNLLVKYKLELVKHGINCQVNNSLQQLPDTIPVEIPQLSSSEELLSRIKEAKESILNMQQLENMIKE